MVTYFLHGEDKSHRLRRISRDSHLSSSDDGSGSVYITRSRSSISLHRRPSVGGKNSHYSSHHSLDNRTPTNVVNRSSSSSHLRLEYNSNDNKCGNRLLNTSGHVQRDVNRQMHVPLTPSPPLAQTVICVDDTTNLIANGNGQFASVRYLDVDTRV